MSLVVDCFAAADEWRKWQAQQVRSLAAEAEDNAIVLQKLHAEGLRGKCQVCRTQRWFRCPERARNAQVSLRESLVCDTCRSNARQRALAQILFDSIDAARSDVYLTEQASAFYLHLRPHCRRLWGSEFTASWRQRLRLSIWLMRQGTPVWLRREDVTDLSFADRSIDALASLDVLEHVPDYRRALAQYARVLRPGGTLLMTVPFYSGQADNVELARVGGDGAIEHLQPPEFHGDPLSGGVLCFHHFGWELLAQMRAAGFAHAHAVRVRDPDNGLPEAQWLLRATR